MHRSLIVTISIIGNHILALQLELAPYGQKYQDKTFTSFPDGGELINLTAKIFLGSDQFTQAYVRD